MEKRLFVKISKEMKKLGIAGLEIEHTLKVFTNSKGEQICTVLIQGSTYEIKQSEIELKIK